tara:strand:- start:1417 stop:1800 length:384 start_codon:yes stop_codon:yes gene_type:complete
MKIERMNKGQWGKVRAFFDLTTQEGFTIKGFKIIEGINGLFVSMPSQKGNDGEYYDSVFAIKETRDQLNKVALDEYSGENFSDSSFSQQSQTPAATVESSPDSTSETATNESVDENNKPYEDSDIPF